MNTSFTTALEVTAVVLAYWMVGTAGASSLSLAIPVLFSAVVFIFAGQRGYVSRVLILRPFAYLGKISYSIYLVHMFIVLRATNALELAERHTNLVSVKDVGGHMIAGPTALAGDSLSLFVLVIAIATASLTYPLVELPANQWVRRRVLVGPRDATHARSNLGSFLVSEPEMRP